MQPRSRPCCLVAFLPHSLLTADVVLVSLLLSVTQAPQQNFLGLAVDLCYLPLDDAALAAPMLQVGERGRGREGLAQRPC